MVSLIATDLDGTFLGADKMPSAENTEAMLAAAEAGVHVDPAGLKWGGERRCHDRRGPPRHLHEPHPRRRDHCRCPRGRA